MGSTRVKKSYPACSFEFASATGGSNEITDASLQAVAQHCRQLQKLNVSMCWQVTDAVLQAVAQHCRQLQTQDVSGCEQATDVGVMVVAQHCPQLQQLGVRGCNRVTWRGLAAACQHCTQLQKLVNMDSREVDRALRIALGGRCEENELDLGRRWWVED